MKSNRLFINFHGYQQKELICISLVENELNILNYLALNILHIQDLFQIQCHKSSYLLREEGK